MSALMDRAMPKLRVRVADQAGHCLIATHASACAGLIDQHMGQAA